MRNDATKYYNDFTDFFANGHRSGGPTAAIGTMQNTPFENQLLLAAVIYIRRATNFKQAFTAVCDAATHFYTMIENKTQFLTKLDGILAKNDMSSETIG